MGISEMVYCICDDMNVDECPIVPLVSVAYYPLIIPL
jgi:hypothetical protein